MPKKSPLTAVALAALAVRGFTACSEDEAPPAPVPEGAPDLQILSFDAPGAHSPTSGGGQVACFPVGEHNPKCKESVSAPGCGFVVVLKTNLDKQIPLLLPDGSQPRFWTFEPPLGCNGAPDCGYALLLIDPKTEPCAARPVAAVKQIAAGPVISVDFEDLRALDAGAFGPKTVRVELWPGEGIPDKEHCHFTEVTVDFQLTCGSQDGGPTDGGFDARPDGSTKESGVPDAAPDAPQDASADGSDGTADVRTPDVSAPDAAPDVSAPDGTVRDAGDGSPPSDGSLDSG